MLCVYEKKKNLILVNFGHVDWCCCTQLVESSFVRKKFRMYNLYTKWVETGEFPFFRRNHIEMRKFHVYKFGNIYWT